MTRTLSAKALAEQETIAAEVRSIVTADLLETLNDAGVVEGDLLEALALLRHLRANRTQEAVFAHSTLVAAVQSDLGISGCTQSAYPKLIELLFTYCDLGGMVRSLGKWITYAEQFEREMGRPFLGWGQGEEDR
jgi:hypothetical protein